MTHIAQKKGSVRNLQIVPICYILIIKEILQKISQNHELNLWDKFSKTKMKQ